VVRIILCGGDEAGRGALLGPLVISLVAAGRGAVGKFSKIGVRDSKLLSRRRREMLYEAIRDIASEVKVDVISPQEINDAMKNSISLNELEAIRFARLYDSVGVDVDTLYLDSPDVIADKFGIRVNMASSKPTRPAGVKQLQKGDGIRYARIIAEHKADSKYPVVSAASIVAKVTRDRAMDAISNELGMDLGSGYPSDDVTIEAVKRNLDSAELLRHIRDRWATMQNIKQTRLASF
jgi:ribonuclease HII